MQVLYVRCAGLDVHKESVVACARLVENGEVGCEVRSFGTTTTGLLDLSAWLSERGCTHVVMEATGVYWKPVWHILEGTFELVLANAAHVKNVPGRKTDVNDATWLAELLAHGLIRGSFVPPRPIQEIRDLTRTRKQLVREIARHTQRIQKTLEDANIKMSAVVSDMLGRTGRTILDALVAGETDPDRLADLGPRLKASREALVEAFRGRGTEHHRFLLKVHLSQVDALNTAVEEVEQRLGSLLEPFRYAEALLIDMPGVSLTVAQGVISEIGVDMSRFPTAGHLLSWAGMCPRSDTSAGKHRSTRVRKGAPWLKTMLVQAAWAAVRSNGSYYRAQFLRLRGRRGPKKAIVAVGASMLTAMYYMLRDGVVYQDLGADHFYRLDSARRSRTITRLVGRLHELGCEVELKRPEQRNKQGQSQEEDQAQPQGQPQADDQAQAQPQVQPQEEAQPQEQAEPQKEPHGPDQKPPQRKRKRTGKRNEQGQALDRENQKPTRRRNPKNPKNPNQNPNQKEAA